MVDEKIHGFFRLGETNFVATRQKVELSDFRVHVWVQDFPEQQLLQRFTD